jgi:CDP-diglyceride synthetase
MLKHFIFSLFLGVVVFGIFYELTQSSGAGGWQVPAILGGVVSFVFFFSPPQKGQTPSDN